MMLKLNYFPLRPQCYSRLLNSRDKKDPLRDWGTLNQFQGLSLTIRDSWHVWGNKMLSPPPRATQRPCEIYVNMDRMLLVNRCYPVPRKDPSVHVHEDNCEAPQALMKWLSLCAHDFVITGRTTLDTPPWHTASYRLSVNCSTGGHVIITLSGSAPKYCMSKRRQTLPLEKSPHVEVQRK